MNEELEFTDLKTAQEQHVWEHYQKMEWENYNLKKNNKRLRKSLQSLEKQYILIYKKLKELEDSKKPRFRNNGKKRVK